MPCKPNPPEQEARMYVDTELGTQMVRWRRELHQFPETGFN